MSVDNKCTLKRFFLIPLVVTQHHSMIQKVHVKILDFFFTDKTKKKHMQHSYIVNVKTVMLRVRFS